MRLTEPVDTSKHNSAKAIDNEHQQPSTRLAATHRSMSEFDMPEYRPSEPWASSHGRFTSTPSKNMVTAVRVVEASLILAQHSQPVRPATLDALPAASRLRTRDDVQREDGLSPATASSGPSPEARNSAAPRSRSNSAAAGYFGFTVMSFSRPISWMDAISLRRNQRRFLRCTAFPETTSKPCAAAISYSAPHAASDHSSLGPRRKASFAQRVPTNR